MSFHIPVLFLLIYCCHCLLHLTLITFAGIHRQRREEAREEARRKKAEEERIRQEAAARAAAEAAAKAEAER